MSVGDFGLCVPYECSNAEIWTPLLDLIIASMKPSFPPEFEIEYKLTFPEEEKEIPFTKGFLIALTLMTLILMLAIFGSFYTLFTN